MVALRPISRAFPRAANFGFFKFDRSFGPSEQFAVAVPRHGLRAGSARGAGRVGCSHAGAGARAAFEARCELLLHCRDDDTRRRASHAQLPAAAGPRRELCAARLGRRRHRSLAEHAEPGRRRSRTRQPRVADLLSVCCGMHGVRACVFKCGAFLAGCRVANPARHAATQKSHSKWPTLLGRAPARSSARRARS